MTKKGQIETETESHLKFEDTPSTSQDQPHQLLDSNVTGSPEDLPRTVTSFVHEEEAGEMIFGTRDNNSSKGARPVKRERTLDARQWTADHESQEESCEHTPAAAAADKECTLEKEAQNLEESFKLESIIDNMCRIGEEGSLAKSPPIKRNFIDQGLRDEVKTPLKTTTGQEKMVGDADITDMGQDNSKVKTDQEAECEVPRPATILDECLDFNQPIKEEDKEMGDDTKEDRQKVCEQFYIYYPHIGFQRYHSSLVSRIHYRQSCLYLLVQENRKQKAISADHFIYLVFKILFLKVLYAFVIEKSIIPSTAQFNL